MYNNNIMNRTQIYLPKTQTDALRILARRRRSTLSEVIRVILGEKLRGDSVFSRRVPQETLLNAAKRINALGKKGPRDLASGIDRYLYGEE